MNTSDAELLRRYANTRAEDAFAEIVRRHLKLVYFAACRRTGDPQLAEDVAQQVFTALARDAAALSRHAVLTGWLYTTTRFVAANLLRTERRRQAREQEMFLMRDSLSPAEPHPTGSAVSWEQMRPFVDAALDELGERDREAVLLRFFEGRAFAEIGAALQVKEDAARMRVDRALNKLRALLEQRGVTSTAAALGLTLANQSAAAVVPAGLAVSVTSGAIAGVGTAGVLAMSAGVLGFMSTAKIIVTVGVLVGAAGVGSAIRERAQNRETQAGLAALRREHENTVVRLAQAGTDKRETEQRARMNEERVAALQSELAAARGGAGGAARGANSASVATAAPAAGAVNAGMEMLAHPDYVKLSVEKYRAGLGLQCGPLYKMLRLTPEQIARFEANRTEFQQVTQELYSAAVAKGVSVSTPGIMGLAREPVVALERELKEILGEPGYAHYTSYKRAESGLEVVTTVAGNLFRTDTPLTPQQGEELTQAVVGATKSVPTAPGSKVVRFETDWTAVAAQAQGALTAQQLAVFNAVIEGKRLQQQMSALSSAIRASTNPKPGG